MFAQHTLATPRADRRFFTAMAIVAAITVFAGFAPTYFLKGAFGAPALPLLVHVHGLLFTSWILLFVTQTSLVAVRRTDIHRRLGILGAVLASAMVVVGLMTAIAAARRGASPAGGPPALQFLVIPFGDILVFASLIGTGLYFRRQPQIHKRLLLLATISLLTAAIARLPHVLPAGPLAFFGLTDLFVVACLAYDLVVRGRIHPAFIWGGLLLVLSQPLRLLLAGTDAWLAFATWLTR
jgi:hypothetical protein